MQEKLEFLSAVLLVSKDAKRLADFYRGVLNVPLEDEQHDETVPHYGCTLGDLHFAIHPIEDFQEAPEVGVGSVKMAFAVFNLAEFVKSVEARGGKFLYPMKDLGWTKITALKDPDGNLVEFSELGDEWYRSLEDRKKKGLDVVTRWKSLRSGQS